jgi:hypothetical protein
VHTYTGTSGPDSSRCGPAWANDTYDATFVIEPQSDGSYTIVKTVKGSFLTLVGAPEPNLPGAPSSCPGPPETGGVPGTFYGTETWSVPVTGAKPPEFDPQASCGSACSPTTTSNSSNTAQDNAFQAAFFPDAASSAGPTNFDFVYTSGDQTWIDSTTAQNGGNITNG